VITLAEALDVTRGAINRWLQWYEAEGIDGLRTLSAPGRAPKLGAAQQQELITLIEAGPQQAGYSTGIWTGPMVGDLIHRHFGVRYHNHHVPWVLHRLGFSVQRPRKRLARADKEKQELWLRETFPALRKKATSRRGVILFEDEASFWLDGTLHRTWAPVGQQPRVDTFGQRKTAHVYGAVSVADARSCFQFASVFSAVTYLGFLKLLVSRYPTRKVFLISDNGPCHNLNEEGKKWLSGNAHHIELHRLPPTRPSSTRWSQSGRPLAR
jgi:transposase